MIAAASSMLLRQCLAQPFVVAWLLAFACLELIVRAALPYGLGASPSLIDGLRGGGVWWGWCVAAVACSWVSTSWSSVVRLTSTVHLFCIVFLASVYLQLASVAVHALVRLRPELLVAARPEALALMLALALLAACLACSAFDRATRTWIAVFGCVMIPVLAGFDPALLAPGTEKEASGPLSSAWIWPMFVPHLCVVGLTRLTRARR